MGSAADRLGAGEWQDPDFLDLVFPLATRVTLLEGEKLSIGPKLIAR